MALRAFSRSIARQTLTPAPRAFTIAPRQFTSFVGVQNLERDAVSARLDNFYGAVIGTNWGDYFNLIQDQPFWDAELEKLDVYSQPYLSDPEIGAKVQKIHRMMDCMYQCEDGRDFMNELGELCTRASGLMGTGANAGEPVENLEELSIHCADFYEEMQTKYPELKPKVEQVLGHGIALLRMKSKFRFDQMHRYMF